MQTVAIKVLKNTMQKKRVCVGFVAVVEPVVWRQVVPVAQLAPLHLPAFLLSLGYAYVYSDLCIGVTI